MSLQLVWLVQSRGLRGSMNSTLQLVDSLRPDELIWLHAYMTGRVHALMPATHLQMSGRPMGTQARVPEAATSVSCEQSTPPRGLRMAYLTPTCGSHMQYVRATGLSSDDVSSRPPYLLQCSGPSKPIRLKLYGAYCAVWCWNCAAERISLVLGLPPRGACLLLRRGNLPLVQLDLR